MEDNLNLNNLHNSFSSIQLLFEQFDTDKDNNISKEDYEEIQKILGYSCPPLSNECVSFSEFINLINKRVISVDNSLKFIFDKYKNEENQIDRNELRLLLMKYLDDKTQSEIEEIVDKTMGESEFIKYSDFHKIKINL